MEGAESPWIIRRGAGMGTEDVVGAVDGPVAVVGAVDGPVAVVGAVDGPVAVVGAAVDCCCCCRRGTPPKSGKLRREKPSRPGHPTRESRWRERRRAEDVVETARRTEVRAAGPKMSKKMAQ